MKQFFVPLNIWITVFKSDNQKPHMLIAEKHPNASKFSECVCIHIFPSIYRHLDYPSYAKPEKGQDAKNVG